MPETPSPRLDLDAIEARWQPVPEPGSFVVTGGAGGSSPSSPPSVAGNHGGGWEVVGPIPGGGGGGSTATTHNRAAKDIAALINRIRELEAESDAMQPSKWWRVTYEDGSRLWCETSSEKEARNALSTCPGGGRLQRLYEQADWEWRAES